MNWQLIEFDSFSGKYNMDFDLQLVRSCKGDTPILRFYGWNPPCISLGTNQSLGELNAIQASKDNIDIVKRPTGGRAILHAEELTYSVIMPNHFQISGKMLYENISKSIVCGLKSYHPKLNNVELENINPNFSNLLKDPSGGICFTSTAKSEIKYNNKKLVGSAQRKMGSTILQHGSILIGKFHHNLIDYLEVSKDEKEKLQVDILEKTTEIETITNKSVNIRQLQNNIVQGFAEVLGAQFLIPDFESISQ